MLMINIKCNNKNYKHLLMTSINSRLPSVHKRLLTPLFVNGFSAISYLFFVVDQKEHHFWNWCIFLRVHSCYMQIFNLRDQGPI